MIKILLVDDERSVLNLLRHFITSPEMEIVAATQSSEEALELASQLRPDVVISDIRMPELSGLDMVRQMKERYPDMDFIMISGYQDFEYAYHALKLGVTEYLLKPIRQSELLEALEKLMEKRREGSRVREITQTARRQRMDEENRSVRKKSWLQSAVSRALDMTDAAEEFLASPDCFDGSYRYVQGIVVKIDHFDWQEGITAQDVSKYTRDVSRYVMQGAESLCADMEYITDGNKGYILLCHNVTSEMWDTLHKRYNIYIKEENYKYEGHLTATICIGSRQETLAEAPLSFLHALITLHGRIEFGAGKILEYESRKYWNGEKLLNGEMMERYFGALQKLDEEAAVMEMKRLFETVRVPEGKGGYYYAMAEQFMELTEAELISMADTAVETEAGEGIQEVLDNCSCLEHVIRKLEDWLAERIRYYDELFHRSESKVIKTAKAFVNENYSRPIGLNETAEVVSLNPIYFSAVFKEQTGEKFTAYLQNVRIGKAKELLRTTNLPVKKVAEQVGYIDEKYFSRLFFKATGVKPAEYRKYYAQ